MLIQIHHQDIKTGESEMLSQIEIPDGTDESIEFDIIRNTMDHLRKMQTPPEGKRFMICTEKSEDFVWASEKI